MTAKIIIPAYPGFHLIRCIRGDAWVDAPIIAWILTKDGPWPVTDEEVIGIHSQEWAILRPDGEVVVPMTANYKSFEMFKLARAKEHPSADEPEIT